MYLIYSGPSQLDGQPIVVLLTGHDKPSLNKKTGPMLQTFILREDISPIDALRSGEDKSICGDCPLRNKACYVTIHQAPQSVWLAYKRGNFEVPKSLSLVGFRKGVRIGSYGDGVAVPLPIWEELISKADFHTGYSHSWHLEQAQGYKHLLQASVETEAQAHLAQTLGWKTFRAKRKEDPKLPNETYCLADSGNFTCATCRLCNGTQKNIVIDAHGGVGKVRKFYEIVEAA